MWANEFDALPKNIPVHSTVQVTVRVLSSLHFDLRGLEDALMSMGPANEDDSGDEDNDEQDDDDDAAPQAVSPPPPIRIRPRSSQQPTPASDPKSTPLSKPASSSTWTALNPPVSTV